MTDFSIAQIRSQFPSLSIKDDGKTRVYLDNPAGTQVPNHVIARMNRAMIEQNANLGGFFTTTLIAEALVNEAHETAAKFYNARSANEIIFGANMTTLTMAMSRNLQKTLNLGPDDEIVLSRMDHDANVSPWLLIAEDTGATVKWLDFDTDTYEFADDAIDKVLTSKTKIVAMGHASNCTGTINDVKAICAKARSVGAISYIDAVQSTPHMVIDVQDIGCDFLVSSAYKWFGPHHGILYGRLEVLENLFSYQVRPALGYGAPGKFETGTAPRETLAGTLGAMEYIASLGSGDKPQAGVTRDDLTGGMKAAMAHEASLTRQIIGGLTSLKGVTVRGITSDNALARRVPTVSITVAGKNPQDLAKSLADENIFLWSGHNYALEPINRMGLMEQGGVLRIGMAHYNTTDEVDTLLERLEGLI